MKTAKVKQGRVPPVYLALMFLLIWLVLSAVPAFARDYAVQIAAVRSQQSADDMRSGLLVQGLEAYWVKRVLPKHGLLYRVRLGKFPSVETAYRYAEGLLNSGLLESYAITAYEAPMSEPLRDMMQASIEVQEYIEPGQQGPSPREANELFAAIGARQWLLPSSRNLFAPKPQISSRPKGMSGREMLVYALRRNDWRMTPDPSVLFVRAPVAASNLAPVVNLASPKFDVPPAREPVPAINQPLTPPPIISSTTRGIQPTTNSFGAERNIAADIGKGRKPTASRGIGYGGNAGQARLQATSEVRDGQLMLKLRNLDLERSFTGLARVTLSDDKNSNEVRPVQFILPPNAEVVLPINEPVAMGGNWMLMVFDENNVMRLLRGASVGQKPAPPSQNQNDAAPQVALNPPPYVTGVYDATPAQAPGLTAIDSPNLTGIPGASSASSSPALPPSGLDAPAQLTVTPRQIAATSENVTIEFDIASPQPLNYISVTVAAGEYRDVRQALMSTTRGRVPFMIPAAQATSTFLFEIKDEAGRVLAGGAADFRQLSSGR